MRDQSQVPAEIFDWLMIMNFEELQPEQQQLVLQYMSAADYAEMRSSFLGISSVAVYSAVDDTTSRQRLLHHFDKVYPPQQATATLSLRFWQAAASFLLMVCVGLSFLYLRHKNQPVYASLPKKTNTIVVTRLVTAEPVTIHDTLYQQPRNEKMNQPLYATKHKPANPIHDKIAPPTDELTIVSVDEYGNSMHAFRGNSIQDDTLVQQFHFVSL